MNFKNEDFLNYKNKTMIDANFILIPILFKTLIMIIS